MSSVSSKSGSSGQDDAIRTAREDYRKKEAELIKKHNKEIRDLNDRYTADLDRKDRVHASNLNEVRAKSQESLTHRDVKYRKEMDDLRSMHTRQLEKLMQDNRQKLEAQSKASHLEVKQANLGKEDRTKDLHDRYEKQLAAESEKFSHGLQTLRDDQKQKLNENRDKLNEAHEKELDQVRDERDAAVSNLEHDYRRLRQNTNERLRGQEVRHMQDKLRMESAHMDNIQKKDEAHAMIQGMSREGYQEGIKDVRQRMAQAREQDLENQGRTREQFRADVEGRIDAQVNRLERDLAREKNANILDKTRQKQDVRRQLQNMQDAYQTKFDYLEKARQETLEQSNEINAENIREIRGEADKQMANNTRYYIDRMSTENFKNRQALDHAERDFALRQAYTAENADSRVERIRNESHISEAKLRDNYGANLEVLRQSNDEEKKELRMAVLKDKNESIQVLKDQAQKQEVEHQRTLNDTIAKYEKRISDMNEQSVREKRLRDNREKTLVNDLKRQHDTQIEALKIQYEEQNKQTTISHEREMKDVSRRNQEKLDEVLRTVKKS